MVYISDIVYREYQLYHDKLFRIDKNLLGFVDQNFLKLCLGSFTFLSPQKMWNKVIPPLVQEFYWALA